MHITNVITFQQGLAMGSGNEFFVENNAPSAIVQVSGKVCVMPPPEPVMVKV